MSRCSGERRWASSGEWEGSGCQHVTYVHQPESWVHYPARTSAHPMTNAGAGPFSVGSDCTRAHPIGVNTTHCAADFMHQVMSARLTLYALQAHAGHCRLCQEVNFQPPCVFVAVLLTAPPCCVAWNGCVCACRKLFDTRQECEQGWFLSRRVDALIL